MDRKPFEQRFAAMRAEFSTWEPTLRDIRDYMAPTRGFFDGATPNDGKKIDHKKVMNGHAVRALDIMAAGMTSGMTSPSRPWFRLGLEDPDLAAFGPVKEWLEFVQTRMLGVFAKSNIYGALTNIYAEVGGFGTGAMMLLEDFQDVVRARNYTAGEYRIAVDASGRVVGFARRYSATVGQLVEDFGFENLSLQSRNAWKENKPHQWVTCIHLVEANKAPIHDAAGPDGMSFRSVYWEEGSPENAFLRISGFHEFPIMAPRWATASTADVYGRGSPGWHALGDVKMLQVMERDKLMALAKVVKPPVQADSDTDIDLNPDGVSRFSASSPNAGVKPVYQINPDIAAMDAAIVRGEGKISEACYNDLFLLLSRPGGGEKTAYEVAKQYEEKMWVLSPVLDRLQGELHRPLIDRTFSVMMRANILPPVPRELSGMDLKVEYISILAEAQKLVGTASIEKAAGFLGNLSAAYPEARDNFDADEAFRQYGEMAGVPAKVMRSPDDVAAVRKARAQRAREQEAAAEAAQVVQGAEVLSKTKIGEGSALDALLGTGA